MGKSGSTASNSTGWGGTFLISDYVYMENGLVYATSDETLKNFRGEVNIDFNNLKDIRKEYFTWKDGDMEDVQIGTSAQDVLKYYPEIVSIGDDGKLAVSYERLSIIALAAIDKLNERIKILEDIIKDKQ
jgi:hypothetical protein